MDRSPRQSDSDRPRVLWDAAAAAAALGALWLWWVPVPVTYELAAASMQREQGHARYVDLAPFGSRFLRPEGDIPEAPQRSSATLFEDGRALGPPHAQHESIRATGRGHFSHWQGGLYFSTSDGSDPATNGRRYALKVGVRPPLWALVAVITGSIGFLLARHLPRVPWRALRQWSPRRDVRLHSLGWIVAASVPVVLVAVVILALFRWHRGVEVMVRPASLEYPIVDAQIARARAGRAFDVALIGDSACLMGVDSPQLSRRLGGLRVENFCTIGYVGPVGYAYMLDDLGRHAPGPDAVLVIMIHGFQLERDPSWDAWPAYIRTMGRSAQGQAGPIAAARFSTWDSLDPAVFSVLPGNYGRHFGSEHAVRRAVEKGTVVQDGVRGPPGEVFRYRPNAAFFGAAAALGKAIERFGRRTYLVIAPIPADEEDSQTRQERARVVAEIARAFGIPAERVLDTPSALPAPLFASTTHVGPEGRARFTEILAESLARERARR